MAKFHTTKDIASAIDRIIRKSEKFLIILTPYIRFSKPFYERMVSASEKNIYMAVLFQKKSLNDKKQEKWLMELDCNIYDKPNLHAKCYINENEALVCSMNFHSFSEANNVEMGVLLNKDEDETGYNDCLLEIKEVIKNAKSIKEIESKLEPEKTESSSYKVSNKIYKKLYFSLKKEYKSFEFDYNDEMNEYVSKSIYDDRIQLSNVYGFFSVQFILSRKLFKDFKKTFEDIIDEELFEYRVFWHDGNDRVCVYAGSEIEFSSIEDEIEYYLNGIKSILNYINKFMRK